MQLYISASKKGHNLNYLFNIPTSRKKILSSTSLLFDQAIAIF